jgi:YhcG PDDEXK nuclease domain/DUF1016 N-terminal domain
MLISPRNVRDVTVLEATFVEGLRRGPSKRRGRGLVEKDIQEAILFRFRAKLWYTSSMAKKRNPPKKTTANAPANRPKASKRSASGPSRLGLVGFTFQYLVKSIEAVHSEAAAQASRAVNLSLTLRNWLIGCYIAEYELRGKDRATYGERLLDSLAAELTRLKVSNANRRQLYRYLRFYRTYPGIVGTLSPQFSSLLPEGLSHDEPKVGTPSPQSSSSVGTIVTWYRSNVMAPDDNPPIGILLCAARDHSLVEYALAGIDNKLFVSKYQLHLPDREQLRLELERSLKSEG